MPTNVSYQGEPSKWHPPRGVRYIYGERSKIICPTVSYLAVRMRNGNVGWYDKLRGNFLSQDDFRSGVCRALDVACGTDYFVDAWDRATPAQRAEIVGSFRNFDWDALWEGDDYCDPPANIWNVFEQPDSNKSKDCIQGCD